MESHGTPPADGPAPDHYVLRVSATSDCNLHCRYCKPDHHPTSVMNDGDLLGIIEAGVKAGVKKVSWTGGEPTMRPHLLETIAAAKDLGVAYQSMTTNGVTFGPKARAYREAGLNRVNMSLETFDRVEYRQITGVNALDRVLLSIREAMREIDRVKVNCVVTRENIRNIPGFVEFVQQFERPLTVRFLEVVPCENQYANTVRFEKTFVPVEEMLDVLRAQGTLTPVHMDGNVPKSRYFTIEGKKGVFGVNPNHSVGFHCDGEECTKIRVNPQAVVSNCTTNLKYCRDFTGLSQREKNDLMMQIVREKMERNYDGFLHRQRYYDFWRFAKPSPDYPNPPKPAPSSAFAELTQITNLHSSSPQGPTLL
jgi:cyclic pyranopterin phosphate synthase